MVRLWRRFNRVRRAILLSGWHRGAHGRRRKPDDTRAASARKARPLHSQGTDAATGMIGAPAYALDKLILILSISPGNAQIEHKKGTHHVRCPRTGAYSPTLSACQIRHPADRMAGFRRRHRRDPGAEAQPQR